MKAASTGLIHRQCDLKNRPRNSYAGSYSGGGVPGGDRARVPSGTGRSSGDGRCDAGRAGKGAGSARGAQTLCWWGQRLREKELGLWNLLTGSKCFLLLLWY